MQDMDPGVVKAFQDLTYEDETPLSLGEHFKQMGNDRFKRGKKNAMYYRHAQQVSKYVGERQTGDGDFLFPIDCLFDVLPCWRAALALRPLRDGTLQRSLSPQRQAQHLEALDFPGGGEGGTDLMCIGSCSFFVPTAPYTSLHLWQFLKRSSRRLVLRRERGP